jgi:hypothetical protein
VVGLVRTGRRQTEVVGLNSRQLGELDVYIEVSKSLKAFLLCDRSARLRTEGSQVGPGDFLIQSLGENANVQARHKLLV